MPNSKGHVNIPPRIFFCFFQINRDSRPCNVLQFNNTINSIIQAHYPKLQNIRGPLANHWWESFINDDSILRVLTPDTPMGTCSQNEWKAFIKLVSKFFVSKKLPSRLFVGDLGIVFTNEIWLILFCSSEFL